jgi:hypothetical protein
VRLGGAPRSGWPAGLRALFLASGVGLVIEIAQLYWFGVVHGELGPPPSLQATSTLVGLVLGAIMVATGLLANRRGFVLVAYAKAVLWLFVAAVFFASTLGEWFVFGVSPAGLVEQMPYVAWNLVVVTIASVVLWYLASSELMVADEDARSEVSPLPPPVAVDVPPSAKPRD